jgi:hypothetical protein
MEPGDVICSTLPANSVSKLIRALTWSDFSHVSMCVEPKGCIEANENVTRFSLLRVGCLNPKHVKVIRLRGDAVPAARDIRLAAGSNGLAFLGQPYWTNGTFRALFKSRPLAEQPGAFCSHLVATAYREAGFDIVPSLSPQHVTPRDIADCPLFEDISKTVLEEIHAPYIESYLEFLDADRSVDTPHLLEVALGLEVCDDVGSDFQALAKKRPRSLTEAQVIVLGATATDCEVGMKLDQLLTESLKRHYFVEEQSRVAPRTPLYDPDQLVAWLLSDGASPANVAHILQLCKSVDVGSDDMLRERLETLQAYERGPSLNLAFASYLAPFTRHVYELHKKMIEDNRLVIRILEAFEAGGDFIRLAPSGDPRRKLTELAATRGTFVLQAVLPGIAPRKYAGRLQDALWAYAHHIGASATGVGVYVWRGMEGELVFMPPPPLEEGAWFVDPFLPSALDIQDLGDTDRPARVPGVGTPCSI